MLSDNQLNYVKNIKKSKVQHRNAGVPYRTSRITTLILKLPESSTSKDIITQKVDIDGGKLEELSCNIMIIGRNLPQALKVTIDFEYQVIKQGDTSIPMNRTKFTTIADLNCIPFFNQLQSPNSTAGY